MSKKLTKREKKKLNNFAVTHWKVLLAVFLLIVLFCCFAYFMGWFDILFNYFRDDPIMSKAGGHITTVNEFQDMKVNFLDVGQGDCIIIELPDNKTMIIDSGDFSSDQKAISNFTSLRNIDTFDYLLLTHSDRDHVGNMDWVIENYKIGYIFRPNNYSKNDISSSLPAEFNPVIDSKNAYVNDKDVYAEFMVAAYNEKCAVEVFNKDSDFENKMVCGINEMTYKFDFLTPTAKRENIAYKDANNYSPILMLEYAGRRVMFNGDAELEALSEYVDTYGNAYNVDVYKVGHHGSSNATTQEYIDAIDPEYAVIQCGAGNTYGHPEKEPIEILTNHQDGVEIYRNDTNGDIVLSVSASGEMSWTFDNNDMSKNNIPAVKPQKTSVGRQINDFSAQNYLSELWKECIIFKYNEITNKKEVDL